MTKSIYQIFSGTNTGGDLFTQVIKNIDYFRELHIDTIWFTPFYKSNSYHSYDATDYCSIREDVGTMEEFEYMCRFLKRRGIEVMLDFVLCHTSKEHEWFKNHPEFYQWSDTQLPKENCWNMEDQASHLAESWFFDEGRNQYYYAVFGDSMPSLNLDNQDVQAEIQNLCEFWMDKGVSCFRLDAIIHSHRNLSDSVKFWSWFKGMVGSDKFVVGEAWSSYDNINAYNNAIDSCFDFNLQGNLVYSVKNLNFLGLTHDLLASDGSLTLFTGNHDQNRVASILDYDVEKIKLYLWLHLLFAQGNRCLYYMDELGIGGYKDLGAGDLGVRGKWDLSELKWQSERKESILSEYVRAVELVDKWAINDTKIIRVETQPEYNRLAVYKQYPNGKRVKIKVQQSSRNYDKLYTVATFCGYDIVVMIYENIN